MQAGNAFDALRQFCTANKAEWLFGHFGYDLKNETEKLSSGHADGIGFSDLHFFVPEIVLELNNKEVIIYGDGDAAFIFDTIISCSPVINENVKPKVVIQHRIKREQYSDTIERLRQHILRGDCYELNFCQEFFAEHAVIDPLYIYNRLTELSPNPFSAFYKLNTRYCLSASPERYLKKDGTAIFSQPIKGTSKRNLQDHIDDEHARKYLL